MATYYIPTDIAGGTILVNDGDIFIFEDAASSNTKFESATGLSTDFEIQFNVSNANSFDVEIRDDLNADITIQDSVDLSSVYIKASNAESVTMTIGDGVTLDRYDGSNNGTDTIVIGDNFTTNTDFKTQGGDDHVTLGQNFMGGKKIDTGGGTDTVVSQDTGASISNAETVIYPDGTVDGSAGNDVMNLGHTDGQGDQITTGDDVILGGLGDDSIDGDAGHDVIDGGAGADTLSGGLGNDTLDGGVGADALHGGSGSDRLDGGTGGDSLDGGAGTDTLDGGAGSDTLVGGAGDDVLFGGEASAGTPLRVGFKWSDVPDPDDGGQIDDNDVLTTGTQTVGGVDVSFSITQNVTYAPGGEDGLGDIYVAGIDAGSGSVDGYSAASIDDDTSMTLSFSDPVENVQFRINDLEIDLGAVTISALDDLGNPITINVTEGTNVYGSDTDAVSGNDTFSAANAAGDNNDLGSILVSVPGPVTTIQIDYVANNDSLTMSDVWFDDPAYMPPEADGDDTISGGSGADTIIGSDGSDSIDGGAGSDTYTMNDPQAPAGETVDVSVTSSGASTVAKTVGGGTDSVSGIESFIAGEDPAESDQISITDDVELSDLSGFNNSAVGSFTPAEGGGSIAFGGGGEPTINDLLSGTYDPGSGVLSGRGQYNITSGEEDGAQVGSVSFQNFEEINFSVICYTRGTRIATPGGETAVERLRPGDLVSTADHGPQPLRWIGSTIVPARGQVAPVRIRAGTLGTRRDLFVSPQHRMLCTGWQPEVLFGHPEVFAAAKHLVNGDSIAIVEGGFVQYFHLMLDRHEILTAEGAPSESFHPGAVGLATIGARARGEIYARFPDLQTDPASYGPPARPVLRRHEALLLGAGIAAPIARPGRIRRIA